MADPVYLAEAMQLAPPPPTDGTPYSRLVVYAGPEGEAMIAHWHVASVCLPHDHGDAHGVVSVLRGDFVEEGYTHGDSFSKLDNQRSYAAGTFMPVVPGDIHRMAAAGGGLTLHLYAPIIRDMKVYDEKSGSILTVAGKCGAWVPEDPADILGRQPLHRNPLHN